MPDIIFDTISRREAIDKLNLLLKDQDHLSEDFYVGVATAAKCISMLPEKFENIEEFQKIIERILEENEKM